MKCFAHIYQGTRMSRTAWVAWCVCVWLSAVSCGSTPKNSGEPQSALPTLGQLRSQLPQTGLLGLTPDGQLIAMLHVAQLEMPLNASTELSWALTDQQGLDPAMVDAWRTNGLRIGFLKAIDYESFVQALPPGHPPRNRQMIITQSPAACTAAPKHKHGSVVRLTLPPAQRPTTLPVGPGRFQFLAQLVQGPHDTAALRLTPHHYQPRTTVRPRLPQDKIQDGLVFHRLALSIPVSGESWLVIGLYTPQATPPPDENDADPQPDPATTQEPATTQPATPPNTAKSADYILPNHLGRALLTASRFNKPIQMVLIVAVTGPQGDAPNH